METRNWQRARQKSRRLGLFWANLRERMSKDIKSSDLGTSSEGIRFRPPAQGEGGFPYIGQTTNPSCCVQARPRGAKSSKKCLVARKMLWVYLNSPKQNVVSTFPSKPLLNCINGSAYQTYFFPTQWQELDIAVANRDEMSSVLLLPGWIRYQKTLCEHFGPLSIQRDRTSLAHHWKRSRVERFEKMMTDYHLIYWLCLAIWDERFLRWKSCFQEIVLNAWTWVGMQLGKPFCESSWSSSCLQLSN